MTFKLFTQLLKFSVLVSMISGGTNAAGPDLIVSSLVNKTDSVEPWGYLHIICAVKNKGSRDTPRKCIASFYLSKDNVISSEDIRLEGSQSVGRLGPEYYNIITDRQKIRLRVPGNIQSGNYYLIAVADSLKQVKEFREKNNTRTALNKIKVNVSVMDDFVLIPSGDFQIGGEKEVGLIDEFPVHTARLNSFYIGKYEVTNELWDSVMKWGVSNGYTDLAFRRILYLDATKPKGPNHPMHTVSWYDAVKWCNARSQKEGLSPCYTVGGAVYKTGKFDNVECNWEANGYRLPTEAEWEAAARGGQTRKNFPWGDVISHGEANFYNGGNEVYQSGTTGHHPNYATGKAPFSSPVGSFCANGYGLFDTAGNVSEWCWDWMGDYTTDLQTNPRGPTSGSYRVLRGGDWFSSAFECRVAYRNYNYPDAMVNMYFPDLGFRLARSPGP